MVLIPIFMVVIGLCFGSFVTMASYRLPRDQEIVRRRSHCPACGHSLNARDLIPVLSWLLACGKCRYCGVRMSLRYVLIELAVGAVFWWLYMRYGLSVEYGLLALFASALAVLIVADSETGLIPDQVHIFLIPLGVLYQWQIGGDWAEVALTAALMGAIGVTLHYGYFWLRGYHGLGLGDVKFFVVVGIWLGGVLPLVPFFVYSGILGMVSGIFWRYVTKESRFPFGPALAISLFLLVVLPQSRRWLWVVMEQIVDAF